VIVAGEERGTNVRVGVVGSGALAAVRADAFAASHRAEVVVVASRHLANARRLTGRYGARALDSYEAMADEGLDAVLVAVPHRRQDEIVAWALDHRLHVLIGGPLASDLTAARRVAGRAGHSGLVVEAGYEARYKAVWRTARRILEEGGIGTPVSVRSSAAFDQTPESWYYEQEASGGMLVTHLTYAFLNPLRWLLGTPRVAGAVGNARRVVRAGSVWPETCVAAVEFPGDIAGSLYASYVAPATMEDWRVTVVGTRGALEIGPGDLDGGHLVHHHLDGEPQRYDGVPDGFTNQVTAFCEAVLAGSGSGSGTDDGLSRRDVLNPPHDALEDLAVCAAIESAMRRSD
jgi:myo-inositol 2-dehydrogenase/D-chiro-inositol 1-dehydrogenase